MEKELLNSDKELLLKDLCARLPYGVKCQIKGEEDFEPLKLKSFIQGKGFCAFDFYIKENSSLTFKELDEFKPYLFPLSSMTEEQEIEYDATFETIVYEDGRKDSVMTYKSFDWLNKNHFDYRCLIEKSLALDATNLGIHE